jgi:periplasmic protein TonB
MTNPTDPPVDPPKPPDPPKPVDPPKPPVVVNDNQGLLAAINALPEKLANAVKELAPDPLPPAVDPPKPVDPPKTTTPPNPPTTVEPPKRRTFAQWYKGHKTP